MRLFSLHYYYRRNGYVLLTTPIEIVLCAFREACGVIYDNNIIILFPAIPEALKIC